MRKGMEWDPWYHEMCRTVAKKSQCLSRQIGAILVRDKTIICQGYNGPPRGIRTCDERWNYDVKMQEAANFKFVTKEFYEENLEGKCPRHIPEMGFKSGEGLEWCLAGHAERNVLINAARHGIATNGAKLYMNCGIPCSQCMVEIINAGIDEIIVTKISYYDYSSQYLLKESGIKYRVYNHLNINENEEY